MSNEHIDQLSYKKEDWQTENTYKYGKLHSVPKQAATKLGLTDALILGHLCYMQRLTPRGGYVPYTHDGKRAAYSSYRQIHHYLTFISERTIKSRIMKLSKSLDGFSVFKVKGRPENHYHLSEDLIEELGFAQKGSRVYLHAKDAVRFGILEAALIRDIAYRNVKLFAPYKAVQKADPESYFRSFSHHKRNVTRALRRMEQFGPSGFYLIAWTGSTLGYRLNTATRQLCHDHYDAKAAKSAQTDNQTCTANIPNLHTPLPNLHNQVSRNASGSLAVARIQDDHCSLNDESNVQSKTRDEKARSSSRDDLPLCPSFDFDGSERVTSSSSPPAATPVMVNEPDLTVIASPIDSLDSQGEMTESPTHEAIIKPRTTAPERDQAPPTPLTVETRVVQARSNYLHYETFDATKLDRHGAKLVLQFKRWIAVLEICPGKGDTQKFTSFLKEHPLITLEDLEMAYQRVLESEKSDYSSMHEGKFNPYFHSCRISTTNQLIAQIIWILEDIYRADRSDGWNPDLGRNALKPTTPAHLRTYIQRARSRR